MLSLQYERKIFDPAENPLETVFDPILAGVAVMR